MRQCDHRCPPRPSRGGVRARADHVWLHVYGAGSQRARQLARRRLRLGSALARRGFARAGQRHHAELHGRRRYSRVLQFRRSADESLLRCLMAVWRRISPPVRKAGRRALPVADHARPGARSILRLSPRLLFHGRPQSDRDRESATPPTLALGMEPSRFSKCCFLVPS
jgi:hypothetical protein